MSNLVASGDGASSVTVEQALTRMGGVAAVAAQADAEAALRSRCAQSGAAFTILRLGALVDSAGGVPLSFGVGDTQLLERVVGGETEPPLISRNDAARLVVEVIIGGLPLLGGVVIDAAWGDKWGVNSAGTEEAARTAARQDVISAAVGASTSLVGTSPRDSRFTGLPPDGPSGPSP